jgi:hypothetical protein
MTTYRFPASYGFCLAIVFLLLCAGGCAKVAPSVNDSATDGRIPTTALSSSPQGEPTFTAEGDTLIEMALPQPVDTVMLPVGPQGYAELGDLEGLYQTAMSLVAENQPVKAEDHLFIIRDQTGLPLPAGADSSYVAHRISLERRALMLGAILTEQLAFNRTPDQADSVLTVGYARLQREGFPDSLVPATGVTLSTITADLMKVDNQAVRRWEEYFTGRGRSSFQTWLDRKAAAGCLNC